MQKYKFTKFKVKNFGVYDVSLSVLQSEQKYSIMCFLYNKLYDTYFIKQFNDEEEAVKYLEYIRDKTDIGEIDE
jgi:hypothetical protein